MRGETEIISAIETYCTNFNPLSPCGERHMAPQGISQGDKISIHSPHAGRDCHRLCIIGQTGQDFNPLSPCGERRIALFPQVAFPLAISIHSPHAGRDPCALKIQGARHIDFNPLSPCGERLSDPDTIIRLATISIHSPHAGRDQDVA